MIGAAPPDQGEGAAFGAIKAEVIQRTGLFYFDDKDDLLRERLRRRLRATGCRDLSAYLGRLHDQDSSEAEWAALAAEITIGETFFFRYADQITALRQTILPEILGRNRDSRRIRIWSAGCASGAEPYSLAILLHELLGPEIEAWRVGIVGTDINPDFLAAARRGRFGKWALRSLSPAQIDTYFLPTEMPGVGLLRPQYRSLVRFEPHNLMSLLDGTSPLQFTDYDLILCRNVLIYFHPDTVLRIVRELRNCLREQGWMLVGHAEPNPAFAEMMQVRELPGTVAYRRLPPKSSPSHGASAGASAGVANPAAAPVVPAPRPVGAVQAAKRPRSGGGSRDDRRAAAPEPAGTAEEALARARAAADLGDLDGALAACSRGLRDSPADPALHFYQGIVLRGLGRTAEAEEAFRRAIYLDKSFTMAHYQLGLLLAGGGQPGSARRALSNAGRIAASLPEERILDEADGMTAGAMRDAVKLALDSVPVAAGRSASAAPRGRR